MKTAIRVVLVAALLMGVMFAMGNSEANAAPTHNTSPTAAFTCAATRLPTEPWSYLPVIHAHLIDTGVQQPGGISWSMYSCETYQVFGGGHNRGCQYEAMYFAPPGIGVFGPIDPICYSI